MNRGRLSSVEENVTVVIDGGAHGHGRRLWLPQRNSRGGRAMEYESVRDDDGAEELTAHDVAEFDFDAARYEEFTLWIDAELDRLMRRWKHLAAPNAQRTARFKATRSR